MCGEYTDWPVRGLQGLPAVHRLKAKFPLCMLALDDDRKAWPFSPRSSANYVNGTIGKLRIEAMMDCLRAISDEMISVNIFRRTLIRTYKFRTVNKTLPPLHIFVSRKP